MFQKTIGQNQVNNDKREVSVITDIDTVLAIRIKAFRAIDDIERAEKYYEGHINVLKHFNVEQITSAAKDWMLNPDVYVVCAEDVDSGTMHGGVRVHKYNGIAQLPVESAVGYKDSRVYDYIKSYAEKGTGEACAQWNSRDVKGLGLSTLLIRSAISIINQVGMATLFGLSAPHTLHMFQKVGYHVIKELGEEGNFNYPTPEYLAQVIILYSETLEGASRIDKKNILSLRKFPGQNKIETGEKGNLKVEYDLRL